MCHCSHCIHRIVQLSQSLLEILIIPTYTVWSPRLPSQENVTLPKLSLNIHPLDSPSEFLGQCVFPFCPDCQLSHDHQ